MTSHTQAQSLLPEVTILLPTLNEEKAIGKVIDEIKELPFNCQALVIDGLSIDRTREIALGKGVLVLFEVRKGKGIAVRSALRFIDTPYIIMVNADYTYPIQYTTTVYQLLSLSGADVVLGYRNIKEKDSMSLTNSLGNWFLSLLASILYKKRVYDVCTGMWGFRTDSVKKFDLTSMGFTLEADLFINAIKNGCRIEQIPIAYRRRLEGSAAKLKIWDGFKIAWFLLKGRFT